MPTITHEKALDMIRGIIKEKGSQFAAAQYLDVAPSYLSDILAGRRTITEAVAKKLGYRRVVMFEKEVEPQ